MSEPAQSSPPEVEEVQVELPAKLKKKEPRVRSEAQIKASQKGLEVLKAKREAMKEEKKKESDAKEIAKMKWKEAKQAAGGASKVVTKDDFDNFKSDVMMVMRGFMEKNTPPATEVKEPKKEPTAIQRKTPAPTITQAPAPKPQPQKLTGHALLDQLFFNQ